MCCVLEALSGVDSVLEGEGEADVAVLERPQIKLDVPWITIVWNDPVNLMSYVSYVFRKVFGYSKDKADSLMREVHFQGKAVVASGSRNQMEANTTLLQEYGLWATFQRSDR